MTETDCIKCGTTLDIQIDRYIQYQWEERPSREQINKAIDAGKSFGDWFFENHVLCPDCHERIQEVIQGDL